MNDPKFSRLDALEEQRQLLLVKQNEVNSLLTNINQTIAEYKGKNTMTDSEKFAAFKKQKLTENETKFGAETRAKYGKDTVIASNNKFSNLSEKDYKEMKDIENQLIVDLIELKKQPNLDSDLAKRIYQEHKSWLEFTWPNYTKEAHRGLVDMYMEDNRFAKYYDDKADTPVVKTLHDVVYHYTN